MLYAAHFRPQVKIFVVETPWWLGEAHDRDGWPQAVRDPIYSAGLRFLHTLLRDKAVRTTNPCALRCIGALTARTLTRRLA